MANKIQIRRDTAARWADLNPILSQGELGLDTTVGKLKIGNGVSTWAALSFYTGDTGPQGLTGPQGPAGVTSLSQLTNGSHVLNLGDDGKLTVPGSITPALDSILLLVSAGTNTKSASLSLQGDFGRAFIRTNDSTNTFEWFFKEDGTTTFPTLSVDLHNGGVQSGQVLKFSDPAKQVIITGPTPADNASAQRLIIQGQRATGSGEGGDVYLWGGDSEVNGGDIKIYAGDADSTTSGTGGYVNIDGGNGYTSGGSVLLTAGNGNIDGGHMSLSAGTGNTTGGNLTIASGYGGTTPGNIYVNAYNHQWTFNSDGSFTLPATSNSLSNVNQIVSTRIYRPTTNNDTTAINTAKQQWLGSEAAWSAARDQDEIANGVRPWHNMPSWQAADAINAFTATNPQSPGISQLSAMASTARNSYLSFKSLESNIDIVTGNKTFSFENTGNLTLPNDAKLIAGHPTTGYVANTVSLSAENAYISDTTGSVSFGVVNGFAKIKHGDNQWNFTSNGSTEFGGGWSFNNQYGTTQFPNNRLLAPTDNSLDIKVVNNSGSSNAVLSLSNNYATWTFDKDKNFKLPNNAIIKPISSTDTELQLAAFNYDASLSNWTVAQASWTLQANAVGITSTGWPFIAWTPNQTSVNGYLTDLEAAWTAQNSPSSPPSPLVFSPAISQSLYTEIRSALLQIKTTSENVTALSVSLSITAGTSKLTIKGNGKLETPEIIQTVPEENLIIRTRFSVPSSPTGSSTMYTNKDFTFGSDGTFTFPDATIQTTAWTGNLASAIRFGWEAGKYSQITNDPVAIGNQAGRQNQGNYAVGVGSGAGVLDQGNYAIAVGALTGHNAQGANAIAIGAYAGNNSQGANSIAIGFRAGLLNQHANSIMLNASGTDLSCSESGFFVNPVRNVNNNNIVTYDTTTKELTYRNDLRGEGSWTLATGSNTVSFEVPVNGTYTMWVKGMINNGVIAWNATVTVTNANLPALGQQYAYVYSGAGTLLDFTTLPTQLVGTAGTIVRDTSTRGTPSNVFEFVIDNASGSSQSVSWGYTKI